MKPYRIMFAVAAAGIAMQMLVELLEHLQKQLRKFAKKRNDRVPTKDGDDDTKCAEQCKKSLDAQLDEVKGLLYCVIGLLFVIGFEFLECAA